MTKRQKSYFKHKKDFAVFILSHERAETIQTVDMLIEGNYTGDWYVVIDDKDSQIRRYKERFGKHVLIFNKKKYADKTDLRDNQTDLRIGVLARNAIIDFAHEMGYAYHLQLDDDYKGFVFRYPKDGKMKRTKIYDLNKLFDIFIDYLSETDACCITVGVGGDYIGGADNSRYYKGLLRKGMNTFFLKDDKRFYFTMRMNDDVTTNCVNTMRGMVYLCCLYCMIEMEETQKGSGGMTEIYLDAGTYMKSFYTVMCEPSCCDIRLMKTSHPRPHHNINWEHCAPKIIEEKYKK